MATYTGQTDFFYNWLRPADQALMCRVNCRVNYTVVYEGGNTCQITATGSVTSVEQGPAWTHGGTFYNYFNCYVGSINRSQLPTPPTGEATSIPYPNLSQTIISGYYKDGANAEENHWANTATWTQTLTDGRVDIFTSWNSAWYESGNDWYQPASASLNVELDYRPGERKISGVGESHNRVGGHADRKVLGADVEMRTLGGGVDTGNPPEIKRNNTNINQRKLGANG